MWHNPKDQCCAGYLIWCPSFAQWVDDLWSVSKTNFKISTCFKLFKRFTLDPFCLIQNLGVDGESIGYCFLFGGEFLRCYASYLMGSQCFQVNFKHFFWAFFWLVLCSLGRSPTSGGFLCIFLACCFGMLFWPVFYIRGKPETPVIKVKAGPLLKGRGTRVL